MNFQNMSLQNYDIENLLDTSLFTAQDSILVAVSGGIDSVVLLDTLFAYFQAHQPTPKDFLSIAHCNFQLREQESNEDELFVKSIAEKYQVPIFCKRFETAMFAEKNKLSIQVAARQLRYLWFEELLQIHHFQYLATAHHLNDSIETILYNLAKGTGIAGLHGILPKQGNIIRPLSNASREQIVAYAHKQQLRWKEDSSNATDKYSRNLLRHQVIPVLKQINPNLEETLKDTMLRIRVVEQIFQEEVKNFREKAVKKDKENHIYYIDIQEIKSKKENLVKLHEVLKEFGFNFTQTKLIMNSLHKEAGKLFSSLTHTLVRDRASLVITPIVSQTGYFLEHRVFEKTPNFQYSTSPNKVHLDYDKVGGNFVVRLWHEGDRFSPIGMKGKSKNVSDLLNELKIPLNLKKQVYVLVIQEEIAWVVGYRLSEKFKITDQTKQVLELEWKKTSNDVVNDSF